MKKINISISALVALVGSVHAQNYATMVEAYTPGGAAAAPHVTAADALGAPNALPPVSGFVSLGNGGSIVLSFGGYFTGDGAATDDITIFETGQDEMSTVEVWDGSNWLTVGVHPGGTAGFDLDGGALAGGVYSQLRITDNNNMLTAAPRGGADIDAAWVGTVVPEPSSTLLVGLAALAGIVRRKR